MIYSFVSRTENALSPRCEDRASSFLAILTAHAVKIVKTVQAVGEAVSKGWSACPNN